MWAISQLADKMKIYLQYLFAFAVIFNVGNALAQQEAMYTQYMFNTLAINPAYAGSRNVVSATALFRNQWSGIEGAPKTQTFSIDAPINQKRVGLGLQIFGDKLGRTKNTGTVASYAYRIRMNNASLSFGLQGSLSQFSTDYTGIALDPSGTSIDLAFLNNNSKVLLNFGTGAYYNTDRFYVGLSSPELINNVLPGSETSYNKQAIHLFLMSGYVFTLNSMFKLKPSVLLKGVKGSPLQADLNTSIWIKDVLSVGAQYRTNADVSALVEIQATPQIRFGYAYDHSTTPLSNFNSGSHELMLRYEFGFQRGKVLTPRYF